MSTAHWRKALNAALVSFLLVPAPALAGGISRKEFREQEAPEEYRDADLADLRLNPSAFHGEWVRVRVMFSAVTTDAKLKAILTSQGFAGKDDTLFTAYRPPNQAQVNSPFFYVGPELRTELFKFQFAEEVEITGLVYDVSKLWKGQTQAFAMRVVSIRSAASVPAAAPAAEPAEPLW